MKYKLKKGGNVSLSKKDFIASGGEGSIYVHGNTAFKIYSRPDGMIPEQKIDELSAIQHKNIIKPEDVLLRKDKPVGYGMRYVQDTHALCQLFTMSFKKRNNLSPEIVLKLVRSLQAGVVDIHLANILVVDLNEMNFLVDKAFTEVYFIDTDSYQTPHYPATALMDSVKDWHANGRWSQESDWFSWGVVSFQMFTGIHPYKGKHKTIKSMLERMQGNLSVFNKDVAVPKMVPSFDVIPEVYRSWYEAVFERGSREFPPSDMHAVAHVAVAARHISSTDCIEISKAFTDVKFTVDVIDFARLGEFDVVKVTSGLVTFFSNGSTHETSLLDSAGSVVGVTNRGRLVLGALGPGGYLDLADIRLNIPIPVTARGDSIMEYDGRIYLKNSGHIMEVEIIDDGYSCIASTKTVVNVMPKATKLFDGVALQDMLGSWFASFFPRSGASYQVKLEELTGYKIIDAKFDTRVLMVIGSRGGKYDKFVYKFRFDFSSYVLWEEKDVVYSGINFVCLDNGVCAHINEAEELVLFSSSPARDDMKKIVDPMIGGDMRLFKRGNGVLFARGKQLCKLSMK